MPPNIFTRPQVAQICLTITNFILLTHSLVAEEVDFNRDVRPILSNKCFFCHGPDGEERQADLRLDEAASALEDRGGYAAITPGDSENSEIIKRILSNNADEVMPPSELHKSMTPEEIKTLVDWIDGGAEYKPAWAYVPPQASVPPLTENKNWSHNWIDQYILAKLESHNLQPNVDADRTTLIRRIHFDLTGILPTPQEVTTFLEDPRDFEAIWQEKVDELLSSQRFGERLAIYWLDLVRFADTCGYHGDQDHNISPYRDYVIQAFNKNIPFDRFTREQIAGDLLPGDDKWAKVASGYNRLLQTSHEGGIQLKEYDAIYTADRVRNLTSVWMAATVGCAQCHDHKYDPYSIKDFYALGAFFSDLPDRGFRGNSLPTVRPPELLFFDDQQEQEHSHVMAKLASLLDGGNVERAIEAYQQLQTKPLKNAKQPKDLKRKSELEASLRTIVPDSSQEEFSALVGELNAIKSQARYTMVSASTTPRVMRVLPRGNWLDDSGEIVSPEVPKFLHSPIKTKDRASRLDLANWLVAPEPGVGGLTARVFANRFWYRFFGQGISRSLEDFGGQGSPPTHPELLDQLALEFVASGWDVKALVRQIVCSRAYRQSSVPTQEAEKVDPANELFSRQTRSRLPAELIRDNALAASGLLDSEVGGASVKPYQPTGYYKHLNFPNRKYKAHLDARQFRRGLYVHWQRQFVHPMLKAMDAPTREECTAQRPQSNTPGAALALLNDPTFVEAARNLADRLVEQAQSSDAAKIELAFQIVLSRAPEAEEIKICQQLLAASRDDLNSGENLTSIASVGVSQKSDRELEVATWTSVTRALLNLNEAITRN